MCHRYEFRNINYPLKGESSRFAVARLGCDQLLRFFHLFQNAVEKF